MKRIALLLTALVGLIVASCSDDKTEPLVILYGKYAAEKVTITENGNTFTAPGEVTLTKFDIYQPDKAKLTISSFPPFDRKVDLIVSIKEEYNKITFMGDFRCSEGYTGGYSGFKGTASGTCTPGKINIELNYQYFNTEDNLHYFRPNTVIELELKEDYFQSNGTYQQTMHYNGKEYSRFNLLKEALPPIAEALREKIEGNIIGLSYDENGDIELYSKKTSNSEPEMFKGKFRMMLSNIAADEEGARYVCKKLFGKDEIIPELYSQKLGDYYLVNLRGPWKYGLTENGLNIQHRLICYNLNLDFWRNFLIESGRESDTDILTFCINNSYNPEECFEARALEQK